MRSTSTPRGWLTATLVVAGLPLVASACGSSSKSTDAVTPNGTPVVVSGG